MAALYVGNLPFSATEDQVRELFEEFGEVSSVRLICDRESGRPRGYGFVELPEEAAHKATRSLNGQEFQGRALRVNAAHRS